MVIGHDAVMAELTLSLPGASVFLGPVSVGKTTAAEYVRDFYQVLGSDYLYVEGLDVATALEVTRFANTRPNGERRLIVLQMDKASRILQDSLLLTIEAAAESIHFILLSSRPLALTLMSRLKVYKFPLLSASHMEQVLHNVLSGAANTHRLALVSGGQVSRAFLASKHSAQRAQVIQALTTFTKRDSTELEKLAADWSDVHTSLLEAWCQELITGRWRIFEPGESGVSDCKLAIHILIALRSNVRPKLVVRSKLLDVWKDYTT